jgi:hypothetical protein
MNTTPPPNPQPAHLDAASTFDGSRSPVLDELRTLVLSRSSGISIETDDEERADSLLSRAARELQMDHVEWSIADGVTTVGGHDFVPDSVAPAKALKAIAQHQGNALFVLKDFTRHLSDPALSRALIDQLGEFAKPPSLSTIVLLDATAALPRELEPLVTSLDIKLPEPAEYEQAIHSVIDGLVTSRRAQVELPADQIPKLARSLRGLTLNQARQAVAKVAIDDGRLDASDLAGLVEIKADHLRRGGLLEYIPTDSIDAELGGFANLRSWLGRQQMAFTPEARQLNLPEPKGLMLVGVQGCGKSLAAKSIARVWELPLVRLDVGSLYEKYVGESEKNFRQAITIAESLSPAVLWIDEIEKAIMPGGDSDGGLSRRLFGAFLTWLQEKRSGVFVVATANDLSALPPEMLRKGRFDEIFFVDLPGPEERAEIFRIHLMMRRQDPAAVDLKALAAATEGFSGAEIEHVVVTALLDGLQQHKRPGTEAFARIAAATIPLSTTRREQIDQLRATARGRFLPV